MKKFEEFEKICEENKTIYSKALIEEFNRLLKDFKDENGGNEEFGGELNRVAIAAIMTASTATMTLLKNYHAWIQSQED